MSQLDAPSAVRDGIQRPRDVSRLRILQLLQGQHTLSRAAIGETLGLSRATVAALLADLEAAGIIEQQPDDDKDKDGRRGRPPLQVSLAANAAYAVGLDFGHRHLRAAVCDLAGRAVVMRESPIKADEDPSVVIDLAHRLILESLARANVDGAKVLGVGAGIAAPFNPANGKIHAAGMLMRWSDVRLTDELQTRLGVPVQMDNDANAGAMGELLFGAARGAGEVIYVRLSAGVGLGMILEGRLYRGISGIAGEIGHVTVDEGGIICRCGSRGCLETVASSVAVAAQVARGRDEPVSVERLLDLVDRGDRGALRAVEDAAAAVGKAIATTVNLFNPELVIIGGELAQAGDVVLDPIRKIVSRRTLGPAGDAVRVVQSELGSRAEVLGAAAIQLARAPEALAIRVLGASAAAA